MAIRPWLLALLLALVWACSGKAKPLAKLTKADGPVSKQQTDDKQPWHDAPIGTTFVIGDAVQTADGGAELELGNSARIAMQPHTLLRFGRGKDNSAQISLGIGQIDLIGTGNYGFDVGNVQLAQNGAIRITATGVPGQTTFEVKVGQAQVTFADGKTLELSLNGAVTLDVAKPGPPPADAGVGDATEPVDAAPEVDAAPAQDTNAISIDVTGTHGEQLLPGQKKWQKLVQGTTPLVPNTQVRLGNATKAKLTAEGTTLELGGGSRFLIDEQAHVVIESGAGTAAVGQGTEATITVPGGTLTVKAPSDAPGETKLDISARQDTKVGALRGTTHITGQGTDLELSRGESATLKKNGRIVRDTVIPTYFDMRVIVGETPSFYIHDRKGATALQFAFGDKCPAGGVIELDSDPKFRAPRISAGKQAANIMVTTGSWSYRLRCSQGGGEGAAVASGRVTMKTDDGQRQLLPPIVNTIDADGRSYRISYQSSIPDVKIRGTGKTLHFATGGVEEQFTSATGTFTVPGNKLKEATYTYYVESAEGAKTKVTTVTIDFDQTAPQVYIEAPRNGATFGPEIEVKGAVLPGWTAKVDVADIPIDKTTRRFKATVQAPEGKALAIRLSHPRLGIHFYLRRGAK